VVKQAVVLAGGLGSRLGAATRDTPKPLLEVGGVPFLDHVLGELTRCHDTLSTTYFGI